MAAAAIPGPRSKPPIADWLRDHTINILFQIGPRREADLPDVPLWTELAANDDQRQVLALLSGDVSVGRPILTAPNVPAERVKALRQAFDDTMRDPQFIEAAKQAHMEMDADERRGVAADCRQDRRRRRRVSSRMVKDAIAIKDVKKKGQ